MQDMGGNEKSTGLVGRTRERIRDWGFRHPRIAHPFWYFVLLVFVLGVCHWTFNYFNLYHTDADSARYMLSAMVQAQAAIVAIIITLTLIAVQLTASAYTPRVIRVFRNNPDMWILLVIYGVSMLYGLIVLKMVEGVPGEAVSPDVFWVLGFVPMSIECCVSVAYWLQAFTFVALFPYMLNIIDLLKPENIIKRLAIEITEDKILNPKKDPIQPIMDIIHGAVMKYDIATVGCGLDAVTEKAVIDLYKDLDNENVSAHFCDHLGRAGRYAMRAGDDESAREIIGRLKNSGILSVEMPSDKAAKMAAQYIEMIGTFAAEKKRRSVTCDAVESLEVVGMLAAKNGLEDTTPQAIDSLGRVGMYAAENKVGIAAQDAAKYLGRVGTCAAESELGIAALQAADLLGVVGNSAADNKLKYATSEAARSLGLIGSVAAEEELEKAVVESLGSVGRVAMVNELEDATWQAATQLGHVGKVAVEKEFTDAAWQAVTQLRHVGVAAVNRFERVANEAARSIGSIGEVAVVEELAKRSVVMRAIESLRFVGEVAAKQELKNTTWEAVIQLGHVGKVAVEKGLEFEFVVERVIESLGFVGKIAVGNNRLENTIFKVAFCFVSIGIVATEKELKFAAPRAARCLAELTISSKEIVEDVIELNRRGLKENEQEFFDKFMNLYEHELEEL